MGQQGQAEREREGGNKMFDHCVCPHALCS
jgi:hypothetical protein